MSVLKPDKTQKVIYSCLRSYTEDQKENYHENKFGSYKSNKKLLYLKPRSWTRSHQLFWRCIKILPRPVQWSFGGLSKRVERKACPASDPAQKINNNKKPAKTFRKEKRKPIYSPSLLQNIPTWHQATHRASKSPTQATEMLCGCPGQKKRKKKECHATKQRSKGESKSEKRSQKETEISHLMPGKASQPHAKLPTEQTTSQLRPPCWSQSVLGRKRRKRRMSSNKVNIKRRKQLKQKKTSQKENSDTPLFFASKHLNRTLSLPTKQSKPHPRPRRCCGGVLGAKKKKEKNAKQQSQDPKEKNQKQKTSQKETEISHLTPLKASQPQIKPPKEQSTSPARPRRWSASVLGEKGRKKRMPINKTKIQRRLQSERKKHPKKKQISHIWCFCKHLNHTSSFSQSNQHPKPGHGDGARVSWAKKGERKECRAPKPRSKRIEPQKQRKTS